MALKSEPTRLGVLGGTFDPIHYGHLVIAQEVLYKLDIDEIMFVPAGQPPHKLGLVVSPVEHRLAMVELAIQDNPRFSLSRVDVDRPGPSYSVHMLSHLRDELGEKVEIFFIIGLDSLSELMEWHDPQGLVRLCRIVAVKRPGYARHDLKDVATALPQASERISVVDVPQLAISSSDLRRRVAAGEPIKYQVPSTVERYICEKGLYR